MKAVIEVNLNEFGNGVALRAMLDQLRRSFDQIPDHADLVRTVTADPGGAMLLCEVVQPGDETRVVARAVLSAKPIDATRYTNTTDPNSRREEVSLPTR